MNNTLSYRAEPQVDLASGRITIDEFEGGPFVEPNPVGKIIERHTRQIFETRDAVVREALIRLGWTPPPTSRRAASEARAVGEAEGDACLAKATSGDDFNADAVRACMLRDLSLWSSKGLSSEDLVSMAKARGHVPHDDRSFGPIVAGLARKGLITQIGSCPRKRGNGTSGGRIWALTEAGRSQAISFA
ncbi:hypothetical protein [Piscinibacter gummiphilus]|uniref:Uncharacterized protein n=1 Tax=Piscinibacter gummiphilus TaxID=946333 RepID=A0ABZ0CNW1_9BURK|nr:hypothetical protein [Piscinibacter gummiphilus]WOB06533.1 hypothetical protein RXV79_16545 [Piscinibacter gummiphilus]